jgi:indole-3-glycerol phosphate synthase
MLDQIIKRTMERVAALPAEELLPDCHPGRSLKGAITGMKNGTAIIAELKGASPSAGIIREIEDAADLAGAFERGGCAAVSVLTEPFFFGGSPGRLTEVRKAVAVPVLRKDFIIDRRQLIEAKRCGADAVLLIASLLGEELGDFVICCEGLGLEPLVEVRTEHEIALALRTDVQVIGINNRDLATMTVDLSRTARLSGPIRDVGCLAVSESGIGSPADIRALRPYADAFLVGSSIMRSANPGGFVEELVCA